MADYNGDLRQLTYVVTQATEKIDKIDANIEVSKDRLREAEKQSALQEQTLMAVCKKVEVVEDDVKKINLLSKWIGGLSAFFGMLWTLALIYLGLKEG